MKQFASAFKFMQCDRKYWFQDKRNIHWDMFLPTINGCNEKMINILTSICLILYESMSSWRPKTSKYSGLLNCTYNPRKTIAHGTMFHNSAECVIGILKYVDPVMVLEQQAQKQFSNEMSDMPDLSIIKTHIAEVLRQVNNSDLISGE